MRMMMGWGAVVTAVVGMVVNGVWGVSGSAETNLII
jgi:hypothetical protein